MSKTLVAYFSASGVTEKVAEMIADKRIDVTKYIGKKFKLREGQQAFDHAMDRSVLPSKIIIEL